MAQLDGNNLLQDGEALEEKVSLNEHSVLVIEGDESGNNSLQLSSLINRRE